jgi:hypothetical protein
MTTTDEQQTDDLTGGPSGPLRPGVRVHLQERDLREPRSFVGRVASIAESIRVEVLDEMDETDLGVGALVRATATTPDGLYLANTRVLERGADDLLLDAAGTSRYVQRRKHERVPVTLTLQCMRVGDEKQGVIDVETLDLSQGGVKIVAPPGLQVGDVVELTVADADETIGYRGLVIDVRDAPERPGARAARVAFSGFTDAMESALTRLIARHAPQAGA